MVVLMVKKAECPKCKYKFIAKKHLKYRVRANRSFLKLAIGNAAFPWNTGLEEIYKAHLVVCPNCNAEFSTQEYRYFGFIKVEQLRIILLLFIMSFIVASIVLVLRSIYQ